MIRQIKLSSLIVSFLLITQSVYTAEFQIDKSKENQVKFISDAPVEDFEGVTKNIDGYLYYDGEDLLNNSELYFEVDLRTVDTGIGLRNRHMRENYLHTDKYPMTHYKGKIVKVEKASDNTYKVSLEGNMFIHGVTKPLKINGTIKQTGSGYFVNTNFEVNLNDYKIEVPKLMFMRINEIIKLVLNFHLKEGK